MNKNETNPEEELEEQIDSEDEEDTDESTEESEESTSKKDSSDSDARIKQAEAEAAKYRRLFEKAKRKPESKDEDSSKGLSREEVEELLLKKEYDEEELSEIKDLARGKGISYSEAITSPIFQSWKNARDIEKRRNDASLGSSKGGSFSRNKDVPSDRDEHKAYWNKIAGN